MILPHPESVLEINDNCTVQVRKDREGREVTVEVVGEAATAL
jgi:hypothetical protein